MTKTYQEKVASSSSASNWEEHGCID